MDGAEGGREGRSEGGREEWGKKRIWLMQIFKPSTSQNKQNIGPANQNSKKKRVSTRSALGANWLVGQAHFSQSTVVKLRET